MLLQLRQCLYRIALQLLPLLTSRDRRRSVLAGNAICSLWIPSHMSFIAWLTFSASCCFCREHPLVNLLRHYNTLCIPLQASLKSMGGQSLKDTLAEG